MKEYLHATPNVFQAPHRVTFDKARDEFAASAQTAVHGHARVSPPRITFDVQERLISNLLPVTKLPKFLYFAPTRRKDAQGIRREIDGFVPPFTVTEGKFYTLSNLFDQNCVLRKWCGTKVRKMLASEWLTMRSSVTQAFDYLGQGLVLRGDPFEWNEDVDGRTPHLTKDAARKLIRSTLDEYVRVRGTPPRRVVVHKSSRFWGPDHGKFNEVDGFMEGISEVYPKTDADLVALSRSGVKLFREGKYPPLRGTYARVGDDGHFLYAMGYIPYLQTYPGSYVPEPWQLVEKHGGSSPRDLLREVLDLTKMNVNNCSFADGTPITLSFSDKVVEIMKHVPDGEAVQTGYKFYM